MNKNMVRITAAVIDTRVLTVYTESGEKITIPQGDPRIAGILKTATPQLVKQGYADVDLTAENSYSEFEEKSGGMVKFFRIAKTKLLSLFAARVEDTPEAETPATDHVKSADIYSVSEADEVAAAAEQVSIEKPLTKTEATMEAVNSIMQHAVSVTSPEFTEKGLAQQGNVVEEAGHTIKYHSDHSATDTIVAVMGNKVIPGVEMIKSQFTRAAKMGSTKGVETFLTRLSKVIQERKHSVDDLLKFMERGDLPIADDGSILIYKVLSRRGQTYVDCHTKKVEQWVGAYVCMDPSLVDHDRRNECSNGLHVARRGYISEFSGDVCVLAKLAPEDVIAVPEHDANKMRVCGYHIIAELSPEQFAKVRLNQPITAAPNGAALLADALSGNHIGKTHEVRITEGKGGGVLTKAMQGIPTASSKKVAVVKEVEAIGNPSAETLGAPVDPKEVVKEVTQLSRKDQATKLYADYQEGKEGALEALKAFKKAAKVGWDKLGIIDPDKAPEPVKQAKSMLKSKNYDKKLKKVEKLKTKVAKQRKASPQVMQVELDGEQDRRSLKMEDDPTPKTEGSARDRIQKLLSIGLTSVGTAQAVLNLKKQSKKSWETLGVSGAQVQAIADLLKTKL